MEGDDREPFFLVKEMPLSLVEPGHQNSFGWEHPVLSPDGPRELERSFHTELMFGGVSDS